MGVGARSLDDGGGPPREALGPSARASLRHTRRVWLWLGSALLALGVPGIVIVAAAAGPKDQPWLLGGILAVVAVLPGAAAVAWARRRLEDHPLIVALEREPERLSRIQYGTMQADDGDYHPVAIVTLSSGATHTFWILP